MRVAVAGATGYIGGRLVPVPLLLERGFSVVEAQRRRVHDDLERSCPGLWAGYP